MTATAAFASGDDADIGSLREQVERARLTAELREAQAHASLWENASAGMGWGLGWGDLADPFYRRRDDFGQVWLPIGAGALYARQDGRNRPFAWTDIDLDWMRNLARWLATKNDLAIGILRNIRNFTIKRGYTWEARPANGQEANERAALLAKQVQQLIDEHADYNKLAQRERSACWRAVRDGEVFTRHFAQEDGTTVVRFVEPEQVRENAGATSSESHGIRVTDGDVETPEAYSITYDGTDFEWVDASEISHLKRNVDECVKRGLSDFYSSGEALDGVSKLIRNMREAGAVQAAIAWVEQFENSTSGQLSGHIAGVKDLNRPQVQHPVSGRDLNYQRFEPGTIVKISRGKNYLPAPMAGNTTQHTTIVGTCLRAAGCRWNMPEHMVSGDASNNNYASILVSGSPFVNGVECEQDDFGLFFLRWRWIAVRNACAAGLIDATIEEVMRLVDIHFTAPQVAVANHLEESQIDHQDMRAGVMSKATRQARRGLDAEQEKKNLAREAAENQQQGSRGAGHDFGKQRQGQGVGGGLDDLLPDEEPAVNGVRESRTKIDDDQGEDTEDIDLELLAEIFYGLYGKKALAIIQQLASDVRESWSASDHPRDRNGRFIPRGSAEAVKAAKDVVSKVIAGDASADPEELLNHLSILTVAQIRDIGKQHGKRVPKMLREELVSALTQLVGKGNNKPLEKPKKQSKPKSMPALPSKDPHEGFQVVSYEQMRQNIKSKFVPRAPSGNEDLMLVRRPQAGPYHFLEYEKGQALTTPDGRTYVITAVKPGFTRGGEGWKQWEQLVVARPATPEEAQHVERERAKRDSRPVFSDMPPSGKVREPRPGFSGTDSRGRAWKDGGLIEGFTGHEQDEEAACEVIAEARREGEIWKGPSGRYFTLKDGHVVPASAPDSASGVDEHTPSRLAKAAGISTEQVNAARQALAELQQEGHLSPDAALAAVLAALASGPAAKEKPVAKEEPSEEHPLTARVQELARLANSPDATAERIEQGLADLKLHDLSGKELLGLARSLKLDAARKTKVGIIDEIERLVLTNFQLRDAGTH